MIVLATPHHRYDILHDVLRREGLEFDFLRRPEELTLDLLDALRPRYVFFPHWSWKIPSEIFENYECVIFHMTDVPFGRGGSPLQNLIVRGFQETRLSALRCVAELDAGPIYMKEALSLLGTAEEILSRAAVLMSAMIVAIAKTNPPPLPQEGEPTLFQRRNPKDGNVEGLSSLEDVYNYIRMLDGEGYPPAYMETDHLRLEFTQAKPVSGEVFANVRITRKSP